MKPFKNKIALTAIAVLLLVVVPSLGVSVYQYLQLSDEEQVIDAVYKNQLDAILFSVNQYSTDVLGAWVKDLNQVYLTDGDTSAVSDYRTFLAGKSQVLHLGIYTYNVNKTLFSAFAEGSNTDTEASVKACLRQNTAQRDELKNMLKIDYQKIEGIRLENFNTVNAFVFLLKSKTGEEPVIGVFTVNTSGFINEVLAPKIQEVTQDEMQIIIYRDTPEQIIYNSMRGEVPEIQISKGLWLMPGYFIGIELIGSTLDDLTRRRTRNMLIVVVLFNMLVFAGMAYLYKLVRKEIELSKIKSDFVSNVSHEIRTPLAMISMFTETLKMGRVKNDEKRQEYYSVIFQETKRLTCIVNNILNFSRIENQRREYNFSSLKLNDIIDETMHSFKYDLEHKGFEYIIDKAVLTETVKADKDAAVDALVNLVSNAIKYSDTNKYLKISTGSSKGYQYISVEDRGVGIPEKEQKHVFDKFFRVTQGNLATKAQGSGLGLSIVKHIMDAHQGKITLLSTHRKGTTVSLLFPENKTLKSDE